MPLRRALALAVVLSTWLAALQAASAQLVLPGLKPRKPVEEPAPADKADDVGRPIPAVAIPDRAREVEGVLREARQLRQAGELDRIGAELPRLLEEVAELSREFSAIPGSRRRGLRDLWLRLDNLRVRLDRWQQRLTERTGAIEAQHGAIEGLEKTWQATSAALQAEDGAPRAALTKVAQVLRELDEASGFLSASAGRLLELEDRLASADDVLAANIARVQRALDSTEDAVLHQPGLPLWDVARAGLRHELPPLRAHPESIVTGFRLFWRQYAGLLPLHACLLVGFLTAAVLLAKRARTRSLAASQPPSEILGAPFAAGALVALVAARLFYLRSMYAVVDVLGVASLLPLLKLVPRLVRDPVLVHPLQTLVGVLALHRGLLLLRLDSPWHQLAMLLVGVLLWLGTYWCWRRRPAPAPGTAPSRFDRTIPLFVRATLSGLAIAVLAGVLGYDTLLELLIDGFTGSVYWLLLAVGLTRVLYAFIDAGLESGRVRALPSMRNHGGLIRERALTAARLLGVAAWTFATLYGFGLMAPARELATAVLDTTAHAGSWSISLGDLARFGLTMYLAIKTAGLLGFVLEEDVLPSMNLARGVPATVSSLSRYAVLALGFLLAVGAAGVDMGHVTLLASALSVGIGFGLQNVVNNFVSGLMLIFERPVRVGDMVQLGELSGEVRKIGIRASTLRTAQGADVILPNADLISNRVINWTLSDIRRRVEIPIGVAYGSEPQTVIDLVQSAVTEIPEIERFPPPICIFTRFGESSLDFELRIWVHRSDDWPNVRSAALMAVHGKLTQAGIEIPFPQRDLHLRSIDGAVARQLPGGLPIETAPSERTRPI